MVCKESLLVKSMSNNQLIGSVKDIDLGQSSFEDPQLAKLSMLKELQDRNITYTGITGKPFINGPLDSEGNVIKADNSAFDPIFSEPTWLTKKNILIVGAAVVVALLIIK